MTRSLIQKEKKKVRKYDSSKEAIFAISKAVNKAVSEKYLKKILGDSYNR